MLKLTLLKLYTLSFPQLRPLKGAELGSVREISLYNDVNQQTIIATLASVNIFATNTGITK